MTQIHLGGKESRNFLSTQSLTKMTNKAEKRQDKNADVTKKVFVQGFKRAFLGEIINNKFFKNLVIS